MFLKLHHLPAITVNLMGISVVVCTVLAYTSGHVTYYVPYISDTGTYPPESCIFGLALNIVSFLLATIMYVNYKYVQLMVARNKSDARVQKFNNISLYLGIIAVIGLLIVANFQETNVVWLHWTGALFAFGCGALYQCLNASVSKNMTLTREWTNLNVIRAMLAAISTISYVIFAITGLTAIFQFTGNDPTKWKIEDGAFNLHIISTVTEWICSCSTMAFIMIYSDDFKKVEVDFVNIRTDDNSITR